MGGRPELSRSRFAFQEPIGASAAPKAFISAAEIQRPRMPES